MSSVFGNNIKISIFGQSHSEAIGCVIDDLPSGVRIHLPTLYEFMARRAPGQNDLSTTRKEADKPHFLSGVLPSKDDPDTLVTAGAPLCAVIKNTDARSWDYSEIYDVPRPGHADLTADIAFASYQDVRGGGHFSGRLTACLCIAGGILKQMLEEKGIYIGAHISSVNEIEDVPFDPVDVSVNDFERVQKNPLPTLDPLRGELMASLIKEIKSEGDSVGGTVECAVIGLPAGLGAPMFEGVENRISRAAFGIPAVKGIEFGRGFESSRLKGSQNNDLFFMENDVVKTKTNNCGGILGGITNGMPLIFKCAIKPTPTIMKEQESVSLSKKAPALLKPCGRHDPCIVPRAVAVVEAISAIVVADMLFDMPHHM